MSQSQTDTSVESSSTNWDAIDSSKVKTGVPILTNKTIQVCKPFVVMIGIGNGDNDINERIIKDYINVKTMLNEMSSNSNKKIDIIYQNNKGEIVYTSDNDNNNKNDSIIKSSSIDAIKTQFQCQWTVGQINKFNNSVYDFIEFSNESKYNYDCLIYIISCHSIKYDKYNFKHKLYDSNKKEYSFSKICDKFNNANCRQLRKKCKIFILDCIDNIVNGIDDEKEKEKEFEKNIGSMVKNDEIDFIHQYKRILYYPINS